jgi:hypothetical protein
MKLQEKVGNVYKKDRRNKQRRPMMLSRHKISMQITSSAWCQLKRAGGLSGARYFSLSANRLPVTARVYIIL